MKIKTVSGWLLAFSAVGLTFCTADNDSKIKKTESGLKYIFHTDVEGVASKVGDVMTIHFVFKSSTDSIWRNTFVEGQPMVYPLVPPPFKGSLEEGLAMLSQGDSAEFFVSADSLFSVVFQQPIPPGIEAGSDISFLVKVEKVQSQEEMMKAEAEAKVAQVKMDDELIVKYLADKNIKAERFESGLFYQKIKEGKGANPQPGQEVRVHYVGKLMDGQVFDTSIESVAKENNMYNPGREYSPLNFPIGQGSVIRGWDEGIGYMKAGEKGVLYVPSLLAYGERGQGGIIPPNAVLIFDVELVSVSQK